MNAMHPEPSAPEMIDLEANPTPAHSYRAQASHPHSHQVVATNTKVLVGAWDAGFFACFDFCVPNGLHACLCPWVSLAQILSRLGMYTYVPTLLVVLTTHVISWLLVIVGFAHYMHHRNLHSESHIDPVDHNTAPMGFHTPTATLSNMAVHVSSWYFFGFLGYVVYVLGLGQLRTKVRERFQINGTRLRDCVAASCCASCTIAQIATHVKSYTPGSCEFGTPVDTLPGYP